MNAREDGTDDEEMLAGGLAARRCKRCRFTSRL